MPRPAHGDLVAALDDMVRAQRETGAALSRTVGCGRGGLAVVRVLARGPRPVGDLAHAVGVDVSVASRHVAALVEAGLVARDVAPTDRRVRTVALTDAGRALADRHAAAALDLTAQALAGWSDDDVALAATQVRRLAEAVLRHAAAHADENPPQATA